MKNTLKLFVVILVLAIPVQTFAQTFGVKGGLNIANMAIRDNDFSHYDTKMKLGFHLGVIAEFPLSEMLSFETGLFVNSKGVRVSEEDEWFGETREVKMNIFYLDIPLTGKARFKAGGGIIYALAGPYLGIGLSGKVKLEESSGGETESYTEDIEFGSDVDQAKRLDYGLLVGAGFELGQISVGVSYGLGLANMSNDTENGYRENHRIISMSLGYSF